MHDLNTLMLPDMNQPLMLFNTSPERRSLMHYNLGIGAEVQWVHTDVLYTLLPYFNTLHSCTSLITVTCSHYSHTPHYTKRDCNEV